MPKFRFLRGLPLLLLSCALNAQTISTYAGGGPPDGTPALNIGISAPDGIAADASGNVYFSIPGTNTIFRMVPGGAITRFAGNRVRGFGGDGGAATSAQLNSPSGLTLDAAGNLYICDELNRRVRKVAAGTGIITTVAGNGVAGHAGDGGAATDASMTSPRSVAIDTAGNLFVLDWTSNRVRKVAAGTGIITTVVGNGSNTYSGDGGPATLASISALCIALDAAGNLLIGDHFNARVRKVNANTGIISTIAGNGISGYLGDGGMATAARLSGIYGLTLDAAGTLFICDVNNHVIRRVDATTEIITTFAGTGVLGFSGDGGPANLARLRGPQALAIDPSGNLLISNFGRIRRVTIPGGVIDSIAGNGTPMWSGEGGPATSAQLSQPSSLAVDPAGNIFIADRSNFRILKVAAATGIITTAVGTGISGFSGDGGPAGSAQVSSDCYVAVDGGGNLFIADAGNHRVRKVDAATGVISTVIGTGVSGFSGDGGLASLAQINFPTGLVVAANGDLYFSSGAYRVRKMTAATGIISTYAGTGVSGLSGDGGPATAAMLFNATGLALDAAANLYISDSLNYRVRKVTAATGVISTVAGTVFGFDGDGGPATAAKFNRPQALVLDTAGNLYISDQNNQRVRKVDVTTGFVSSFAGVSIFDGPLGDGGPPNAAKLENPAGLVFDPAGNLYIAENSGQRVRKVSFGVPVTLTTVPAGLQLSADATPFTAPQTFQWTPGSNHSLTAPSPQGNAATRNIFASWSNAGTQTQNYVVPNAPSASLTAIFTTQHKVTLTTNGPGAISYVPNNVDLFFDANSQPVFTATPVNACSVFAGWSGEATGTNAATLTMSAPRSLTATFNDTTAPDITPLFTIVRGGFVFNRALNRTLQTVNITNNGAATASSRFAVNALSANATLANSAGLTNCSTPVAPTINTGAIGAGQTISVQLQFTQTAAGAITYTPRMLGAGAY